MRFRLPLRRIVFFLAALALTLLALLPLRLAAGWFDMGGKGLAAREAEGSLWFGRLREAQFGPVILGDIDARLNVLPLFLGRARLSLHRDAESGGAFDGAVLVTRHSFGLEDLTGQLRTGALFGPLPIATLDLTDVSVHFEGGQCESAEGQVRAGLAADVAGLALPSGLSGAVRCQGGAVQLPLAGQSGMEQVNISIEASGRWRAEVIVRPTDPVTIQRLTAAGFAPGAGGYVRRIDGNF
ncbi:MAG TPA: type II secretion system protein N [Allosphingosinicella sp.]|nr:type II secretion system protein N [Allosphingosinicella sp.]